MAVVRRGVKKLVIPARNACFWTAWKVVRENRCISRNVAADYKSVATRRTYSIVLSGFLYCGAGCRHADWADCRADRTGLFPQLEKFGDDVTDVVIGDAGAGGET